MTNGSAAITRACLQRSGLEPYIAETMDIAMVHRWKPHASVYAYAAKQLGLPPESVSILSLPCLLPGTNMPPSLTCTHGCVGDAYCCASMGLSRGQGGGPAISVPQSA